MATVISLLALLATFYQLYLQRVHNEKSLSPLIQIDLVDRNSMIAVYIQNNGVGPFIIEKLTFFKNDQSYSGIEDCLELHPKSYQHVPITEVSKKVILPGGCIEICSTQFAENDTIQEKDNVRHQLATLRLKVEGRDIYNNKMRIERNLDWFIRHRSRLLTPDFN